MSPKELDDLARQMREATTRIKAGKETDLVEKILSSFDEEAFFAQKNQVRKSTLPVPVTGK